MGAGDMPTQFNNPDDFARVKGRGGQYYCKLCKPPDRPQGQAMSLPAALRHEQHNPKHREKVEERMRNDWDYRPSDVRDWAPEPLPEGTNAWEQSWPSDRANDFIEYWLNNMAAVERGERPESMDSFIDRFNEKYLEWAEQEAASLGLVMNYAAEEKVQEQPVEEWDNVQGRWHSGESFEPLEDGFHATPLPPIVPRSPESDAEDARLWACGGVDEDPYEAWGISRDEVTPWTTTPQPPAPAQRGSDDTPPVSQTSPKTGPQRNGKKSKGHRRQRGRVQERTPAIVVDPALDLWNTPRPEVECYDY